MKLSTSERHRYRLADHVRACAHEDQVILLDLRRDRYLGVGGPQLATLAHLIVDWPTNESARQPQHGRADVGAWVRTLKAQQMLADAGSARQPCPAIEKPLENLDAEGPTVGSRVGWRRPLNLARSAATTAFWIRRLSLAQIEDRVCRMRHRVAAGNSAADMADLREAVSSYARLRPFLFTVDDRCLFDSLTLVGFLAKEGMAARWVIGVRTRPFAAHSWAQSGHLVLNDVHEHVGTYTPILVV